MSDGPFQKDRPHIGTGHKFWQMRDSHGGPRKFETPDELRAKCFEYFEWADDHPLEEEKVFGTGIRMTLGKTRVFTQRGMCLFIGIAAPTWREYKARPEFSDVCGEIEDIIYVQKFESAAAGLVNGNIVARELGLADKMEHVGRGGGPIEMINSEMTPQQAQEAYAATLQEDDE